ncbi:Y-family DNA polymerase [Alkalibacterium sp. 20]|uniref:Y-family DNA polymerase n=1 Tax=Alkalibacterium sp. 20 TaxID=1798803 RepID=UPI0008FFE802|nr:Y-family DNA polymerase [Alkalibacterium sp. 20]OJF92918.1 excinuclease ABC subunit A [Alkalibacterium sp. 20]
MMQVMDYSNEPDRDILCIDVKSFFASVEAVERKQHPLKAKIAVVSKPDNNGGLVLAASPLVKQLYGVKTGTRVYEIPKNAAIEIVEPRMALYVEKNLEIVNLFKRFVTDSDLHVYSIDESFLDVTHSHGLFGTTEEIAKKIQYLIWKKMNLVVTIGIGDNPLLAKLALDHDAKHNTKNNYIATWHYEDVTRTVWEIAPMNAFWGIGSRTEQHLQRLGIHSIYDLSQSDLKKLKKRFGVIGEQLFFHSHGIDRTLLSESFTPKETSFSKNQILNRDYVEKHEVEIVIREMAEENALRLRKHHLTTGLVKLSIGYSKDIVERGFSHQLLIEQTDSSRKIIEGLLIIFNRHYEPVPIRVVNVTFGKIDAKSALQLSLFDAAETLISQEDLDQTIDSIRKKHGYTSLLHASSLSRGGMAMQRAKLLGGHRSGKDVK